MTKTRSLNVGLASNASCNIQLYVCWLKDTWWSKNNFWLHRWQLVRGQRTWRIWVWNLLYCQGSAVNNRFCFQHRVLRASLSNCRPLLFNSDERTLRTVLIWRSRTPPISLAAGTFILKENQSHCSCNSFDLILSWSISLNACARSLGAPTKLVPWSPLSWRTGPRRLINRLRALINESVSRELDVSRCIALEAIQVNKTP